MASDALPYTLFLLLLELGVGGQLAMQLVDVRGHAPRGFIKATTVMLPLIFGLAFWVATALNGVIVEGFALDVGPRDALVVLVGVMTGLSLVQNAGIYRDQVRGEQAVGWLLSVLAVTAVALTAYMLRLPTWSGVLVFLSLLAGSLAIGFSAVGLTLGHWYLVTPRLPPRPLNEITFLLLTVIAVQVLLLILALALPVDETPTGGRDRALADDVTFWLRIVVGLALPLLFGWMAWSSSRIRSMMAATGLLYLTTAMILAAEIGARALFFDSARPI